SVTITQATTSVAVASSAASVAAGGIVTLTATVNSQSNSAQGPTGTVQFKNGSSTLGAAVTCTPTGAHNSANPPVGAWCTAQLSTATSALPPGFLDQPRPRNTPLLIVTMLLAALSLLLAAKPAGRRRPYAWAGAALALIAAAALAGC